MKIFRIDHNRVSIANYHNFSRGMIQFPPTVQCLFMQVNVTDYARTTTTLLIRSSEGISGNEQGTKIYQPGIFQVINPGFKNLQPGFVFRLDMYCKNKSVNFLNALFFPAASQYV